MGVLVCVHPPWLELLKVRFNALASGHATPGLKHDGSDGGAKEQRLSLAKVINATIVRRKYSEAATSVPDKRRRITEFSAI